MRRLAERDVAFLGSWELVGLITVPFLSEEITDSGFGVKCWRLMLIPAPGPAGTIDAILAISKAFTSRFSTLGWSGTGATPSTSAAWIQFPSVSAIVCDIYCCGSKRDDNDGQSI